MPRDLRCTVLLSMILTTPAWAVEPVDLDRIQITGAPADATPVGLGSFSFLPEERLLNESSIDIRPLSGSLGMLKDVSIRGGTFEDADVRVGGISLANPQTGHFNHVLPLTSFDIAHARVDRNGQYLNYELSRPARDEGHVRMSSGSRGFLETGVSETFGHADSWHRVSYEGWRTDGLTDYTGGHSQTATYGYQTHGDVSDFFVFAAASDKKFAVDGAYAAPWYPNEGEQIRQRFVTSEYTYRNDWAISVKPYWLQTEDTFVLDRDEPAAYRNDHTTHILGQELVAAPIDAEWRIALHNRRESLGSTSLGDRVRMEHGLGAGWTHETFPWEIAVDIDGTYFDAYPLKIAPRALLRYSVSEKGSYYVRAERKYRKPSFTELFYESPANHGNPSLLLQTSDNAEIGYDHRIGAVEWGADVFIRRQRNTIDWVRNVGDTAYQAVNAGAVDVSGADLRLTLRLDQPWLDRVRLSFTHQQVDTPAEYDISKYLGEYLRNRAACNLVKRFGRWEIGASLAHEDHVDLDQRFLVGGRLYYFYDEARTFFVTATNIFDINYSESVYHEGDPFYVRAGLEVTF